MISFVLNIFCLKENQILLKVKDARSDDWKNYTSFIDNVVLDGFRNIIMCTLKYFLNETEFTKGNPDPLFEAQLQLDEDESEIYFVPSMVFGNPDGFFEIVNGLVKNVYMQGSLVNRVAPHLNKENYKVKK